MRAPRSGEWLIGKQYDYDGCPVTAVRLDGESNQTIGIVGENLEIEASVGYRGGYESCSHDVSVSIPMKNLINLLELLGYRVSSL